MNAFFTDLKQNLGNKKVIVTIVLAALFIVVAIWMYYKYVVPRVNASYVPNKEYVKKQKIDTADIYLFYTNWCPHCKTAKPIWDDFKAHIGSRGHSSGVTVNFIEVDCEQDRKTAEKFNVSGYPTIKLLYNDKVIEYDAKPNKENLQQFLDESLN
jgi:thiol-disulfide isomerase/thioredoxin